MSKVAGVSDLSAELAAKMGIPKTQWLNTWLSAVLWFLKQRFLLVSCRFKTTCFQLRTWISLWWIHTNQFATTSIFILFVWEREHRPHTLLSMVISVLTLKRRLETSCRKNCVMIMTELLTVLWLSWRNSLWWLQKRQHNKDTHHQYMCTAQICYHQPLCYAHKS